MRVLLGHFAKHLCGLARSQQRSACPSNLGTVPVSDMRTNATQRVQLQGLSSRYRAPRSRSFWDSWVLELPRSRPAGLVLQTDSSVALSEARPWNAAALPGHPANTGEHPTKTQFSVSMTSLDSVKQEPLVWTTGGDVATYSPFLVEAACPWGLAVYVRSSAELACHPWVIAAVLANEGMRGSARQRSNQGLLQGISGPSHNDKP